MKKPMLKKFTVLLCIVLIVAALYGCGKGTDKPSGSDATPTPGASQPSGTDETPASTDNQEPALEPVDVTL